MISFLSWKWIERIKVTQLQLLTSAMLAFGSLKDIYIHFNKPRINNTIKIDLLGREE